MASNYKQIKQDNIVGYGTNFKKIGEFLAKQLYNDQTHFVYELLQNTEDALSRRIQHELDTKLPKSITFRLYSDRLEVNHFGKPFDETDVRGICNILEGTKKDDEKQIGKFGIGFKSVYAFTSSPEIHSGDEHFCIEEYIYPCATNHHQLLAEETVLILPFNHQSESQENTFHRIKNRLNSLSPRTLLFLRQIEEISWSVEDGSTETYRREIQRIDPNCVKVTVSGKAREEWLVFEKPVEFNSNLKVEIAFLLSKDRQTGKEHIIPVGSSPLVVFLPTEIETELQFLVQGPYHTTPARDNIRRDDSFNQSLIEHTATLVAEVLPLIRDMGLLTVNCLNVLPIRKSDFEKNPIFSPVFEKVRQAFREKALLPTTRDGHYVPAIQAKLARSKDLRQLLSETQLQQLYGSTYTWLSDEITQGKTPDLHRYITEQLEVQEIEPEDFARKFNKSFIEQQSDSWVANFYVFLNKQEALWRVGDGILRNKQFIRLQNDSHVAPFRSDGLPNAYLPLSSGDETDFSTVKRKVIENQLVGRNALIFLIHLGFSEPDVFAEVMDKIITKYQQVNVNQIDEAEHERDIDKIVQALKSVFYSSVNKSKTDTARKKEQLVTKLKETSFLRAINADKSRKVYKRPGDIYFWSSDLELYFKGNTNVWFLDDICNEQDRYYFETIGVSWKVRVFCKKPDAAGNITISSSRGNHRRGVNGFDPKCEIEGLKYALENSTYGKALYVWNNLLLPNVQHIYGEVQVASNKDFRNPESPIKQLSTMGNFAYNLAWIPDKNGNFYKPSDLSVNDLSDDFMMKFTLASRLGMNLKSVEDITDKLNEEYKQVLGGNKVTKEELELFLKNKEQIKNFIRKGLIATHVNEECSETEEATESVENVDFRKELAQTFAKVGSSQLDVDDFPPSNPVNIDKYAKRVEETVSSNQTNEPPTGERFKKVPAKKWEAKSNEVRVFLKEQYKGKCQICDYTFPKRNSQPYFEGLYLVSQTRARWIDDRGNVLCLCANCCAKFKQGSVEAEDILEQIQEEVEKVDPVLCVELCGEEVKIRFTKKHMIHLQALLSASSNGDNH